MAPLSNGRHEKFAQAIAAGKTREDAYIAAGYSEVGARANASRLIANDSVKARLAELQNASAKRAEITLESLLAEADAIQQQARAAGQLGAANAALKLKSELTGIYTQRVKNDTTVTHEQSALEKVIAHLESRGDGRIEVVPATADESKATVMRYRETAEGKVYLVPRNIAERHVLVPEVVSTEEWLRLHAPGGAWDQRRKAAEATAKPVPAPGSDKVQ